mmetsp:Transcript_44643/g.103101  ORF Transcript_44643/g.103101 Transcript_44643/m.103101 type:complete len:131 (+) Transcript_44643:72-464(+)
MVRNTMLLAALLVMSVEAVVMHKHDVGSNSSSRFTINDIVKINGKVVGEGDSIDVGCHVAPEDASEVTVCGCGVKVVANLLNRCKEYHSYSETVGTCDCKETGCVTEALTSGYSDEKFGWTALSYEISSC